MIRKLPAARPGAALAQRLRRDDREYRHGLRHVPQPGREAESAPSSLGGPIMIARVAYSAAGSSFTELIYFLGILSINLAVSISCRSRRWTAARWSS